MVLVAFWSSNIQERFISWDFLGYYLYLPLLFNFNDIGLENYHEVLNIINQYQLSDTFYQVHPTPENGRHVIQYTIGIALLLMPFYFIGYGFAAIFDYPLDGFSLPFQIAIFYGCLVYIILGLFLLRKLLLKFFNDKITFVCLLILTISTNYFAHAFLSGLIIHLLLFFLITLCVLLCYTIFEESKTNHIKWLIVSLAILALCRATEIIILLIPLILLLKNKQYKLIDWIKTNYKEIIKGILFAIPFIIIQLLYWKYTSGSFITNPYQSSMEEMLLFHPHLLEILFSFRKGWLIYTPVVLLFFFGIFFGVKNNNKWALAIGIFVIVNIYILSCWSSWWYATSFSNRAFLQSYPVLIIALGWLIQKVTEKKPALYLVILFAGACISLNLFQTWQYKKGIIHPDRMTKDYYLKVFGKTAIPDQAEELLLIDRNADALGLFNEKELVKIKEFELNFVTDTTPQGLELNKSRSFSPAINQTYNKLSSNYFLWFRISGEVYFQDSLPKISLVATSKHKKKPYKYYGLDIEKSKLQLQADKWNYIEHIYLSPELILPSDEFTAYFWLREEPKVFIKNLKVEVFESK